MGEIFTMNGVHADLEPPMCDRLCRYCQQLFQLSCYHPHQLVCSRPASQGQRRRDYHRGKIATDPEYAQVVRDSHRVRCDSPSPFVLSAPEGSCLP